MQRAPKAHNPSLALSTAALFVMIGCGSAIAPATNDQDVVSTRVHKMPMRDSSAPISYSAPAGAHLTYYGGRVNAATRVVQVLWGSGSYDSHVSGTGTPSMATFYSQYLSKSTLSSWLDSEYNTVNPSGTKTNQRISSGSFASQVTITPSVTGSTISDAQIQSEITAQIAAGHLPAPVLDAQGNDTTYYALFFPPGKTITQGSSSSCVSGGFCAYHGTVAAGGGHSEYYYGVHPDMQAGSGCATGCGSSTTFNNYTSVASHELVEMITDAEVGIAGPIAAPLAWYDSANGEIGDICNAQQSSFAACDGQSYVYQNEFSNSQNNCIGNVTQSCGTTSNDFSVSASPSSVSVTAGGSTSSTIATATTSGSAQTVSLTVSGQPAGVTASLSPTSVSSGSSSALSISTTTGAAAGTYTLTVTGTATSGSHSATVTLTVSSGGGGGGAITNGGFESGLTGWTTAGTASAISSGCHGGSGCAQVGSTSPTNGDSSVSQTFTAPTGATGLSFFYKESCPDSVTYDWTLVTLKDNTAGTTATPVAKVCATNAAWVNGTASLTAGHSYTLTLGNHDDNYAGDPTYTLYDDVTITSSGGGGGGGITNGGFESGATGWTTAGTTSIATSGCHGGTHCAQAGSTSPTNGDSSYTQTFTVPSGKSQLSVWYKSTCPDTVTYDWVTITLNGTAIVPKTCTTNAWTNITAAVTAGSSYTLTLTNHDDNYSGDPTYTLFDDAVLN
jgi:hypothetical protein